MATRLLTPLQRKDHTKNRLTDQPATPKPRPSLGLSSSDNGSRNTHATTALTHSIYCQEENKWSSSGSGQDTIVSTITCTPSSALARQSSAPAGLVARQQNICSSPAPSMRRSDTGYGLTTRPWPRSSMAAWRTYSGRSPSSWRLGCPSDEREEEEDSIIFCLIAKPFRISRFYIILHTYRIKSRVY